jgi:hypothetical protein
MGVGLGLGLGWVGAIAVIFFLLMCGPSMTVTRGKTEVVPNASQDIRSAVELCESTALEPEVCQTHPS